MNLLDPASIRDQHARVYPDASSRDDPGPLRGAIDAAWAGHTTMGRFHAKPAGPGDLAGFQG